MAAFNLPNDARLEVPRKIEDIFFRDVRMEVSVVKKERLVEEDDDDGNWKRKGRGGSSGKVETIVKVEKNESKVEDVFDEVDKDEVGEEFETDLDNALAAAEEGFTLDD